MSKKLDVTQITLHWGTIQFLVDVRDQSEEYKYRTRPFITVYMGKVLILFLFQTLSLSIVVSRHFGIVTWDFF